MKYIAIDFETANASPLSACAVGITVFDDAQKLKDNVYLIRPPVGFDSFHWYNTKIHGITKKMVEHAPAFDEIWELCCEDLEGGVIVCHNAAFDTGVLHSLLDFYGYPLPECPYICTVKVARRVWPNLDNHKLDTVSQFLGIPLNHHEAGSDAHACGRILLEALHRTGTPDVYALAGRIGMQLGKLSANGCIPCSTAEECRRKMNGKKIRGVTILKGDVVTADKSRSLCCYKDCYVIIKSGKIEEVTYELPEIYKNAAVDFWNNHLIIPAFSDLFIDIMRFPYRGIRKKISYVWDKQDWEAFVRKLPEALLRQGSLQAVFADKAQEDAMLMQSVERAGLTVLFQDCPEAIDQEVLAGKTEELQRCKLLLGSGDGTPIYRLLDSAIDAGFCLEDAFYAATRAAGGYFGQYGAIEKGFIANLLVIADDDLSGKAMTAAQRLERFCHVGDDRNIVCRYISGERKYII